MGQILSLGIQEQESIREQHAAQGVANFNKQIAERNSQLSLEQGEQQAEDIRNETRKNVATAQAVSVGSGVVTTAGSAFLAQTEIAFQGEKEALTAIRQSQLQAQGFDTESDFRRFEGKIAQIRGKEERKGSLLKGIGQGISTYMGVKS